MVDQPHEESDDKLPSSCEKVLVNGKPAICLNDTGCFYEAIVHKKLVKPEDMTGEVMEIKYVDRENPRKTLPVAYITVETRYVRGKFGQL